MEDVKHQTFWPWLSDYMFGSLVGRLFYGLFVVPILFTAIWLNILVAVVKGKDIPHNS